MKDLKHAEVSACSQSEWFASQGRFNSPTSLQLLQEAAVKAFTTGYMVAALLFKVVKQHVLHNFNTEVFQTFWIFEVGKYLFMFEALFACVWGGTNPNDLSLPERSSIIISGKRKCIPKVVDSSCHSEDVLKRIVWATSSSSTV